MVWIIDESKVFAVNDKATVQVLEVGQEKNKAVVVDNFYKNPDEVRNLALNAPVTRWDKVTYGFPMYRTAMDLNLDAVRAQISEISKDVWGYGISEVPRFMTNLTKDDPLTKADISKGGAPHCDQCILAAVVYLNTPEECSGGTAFYRHRKTGLESLPRHPFFEADVKQRIVPIAQKFGCNSLREFAEEVVFAEDQFQKEAHMTESNEFWEKLDDVAMAYNRLVFYEGKVFHAPYGPPMAYTDYYRVIQAMFWTGVE